MGRGSRCVLGGKLFGKVQQIPGILNCGIRIANFGFHEQDKMAVGKKSKEKEGLGLQSLIGN